MAAVVGLIVDVGFSTKVIGRLDSDFHHWLYQAALLLCASVCLVRAAVGDSDRRLWLCFGLGIAVWCAGGIYWVIALADLPPRLIPYPSPADIGYLLAYPLFYCGVLLLIRRSIRFSTSAWLDGGIAALASAALLTAILEPALVGLTKGDVGTVVTNLAYPLGDVILLAFLAAGVTVLGFRVGATWALIGAGILTWGLADSYFLYQVATGGYVTGLGDSVWLLAAVLIASAAVTPSISGPRRIDVHSIVLPVASVLAAIGVLGWDHFSNPGGHAAVILAVATLVVVVVRMVATFRENRGLFEAALGRSETDALTGLGNRRSVVRDLERATTAETGATIFVILDLDGFKAYNDRFGHPAGDRLLRQLGTRLSITVSREGGTAYRLGGDEFCALVPGDEAQVPAALLMTAKALGERGAGFEIAASSGAVVVPREARDAAAAMRIADIRMYAEKSTRSTGAERRGDDALTGAPLEVGSVSADEHPIDEEPRAIAIGSTLAFDKTDLEILGLRDGGDDDATTDATSVSDEARKGADR